MASASTESTRITKLLKETVCLLCENSLSFTTELHVQALLAITVDHSTIYAVQIDEKLAKSRESAGCSVSSGTSGSHGQRPMVARQLALPAPSSATQSSSGDGAGMAWSQQPVRCRGPRFPVGRGRGRGMVRGGRGRGGVMPAVRTVRTAVSSVRFPVSRPRMQATQRPPVRSTGIRSPFQQLALPAPTGSSSAGSSPRQMLTAVVRQRASTPVRQTGVVRFASQPVMRKPSPRLAIMPPGASPQLRQQSPSVMPRQAGPVRAPAASRGRGRPRLAIMPPPQRSLPQSPSQPRPVLSKSSPGLALMPPPQSPISSPSGHRQQAPATSPAKTQMQLVASQSAPRPAAMKQESSPGLSSQLAHLASQLSSSSVGSHLNALLANLSKQQRQPSPVKQASQSKTSTVLTMPAVQPRPVTPVKVTAAARPQTTAIAVTLSQARLLQPSSPAAITVQQVGTPNKQMVVSAQPRLPQGSPAHLQQSPRTPSQPVLPLAQSLAAAVSNQPLHQPFLTTQSSHVSNTVAQNSNTTVTQRLGVPGQSGEMMDAYLLSPGGQFSLASSQHLTAVPLYARPTQAATLVPHSPAYRPDAAAVPQKGVVEPGSPYGMDCNSSVMGHTPVQALGTPTKQMVFSPQPRLPQGSPAHLQQHVMVPFSPQQRQPPSTAFQPYILSSAFTNDMTCSPRPFLSPMLSHTSTASPQHRTQNSPQIPAAAYLQQQQQIHHSPQQVASASQGPVSVATIHQRSQNPPLQSQHPPTTPPQVMPKPREVSAAVQGQVIPAYMQKWMQSPQQVMAVAPPAATSVQQRSYNAPDERQSQNSMSSMHQLMQYRQQTTAASAPQHLSPASHFMPQFTASSPSPVTKVVRTETTSEESRSVRSVPQAVAQAALSGSEKDRQLVLELIKQRACEQLRQGKQQTGAEQRMATVSSVQQVTSSGAPEQVAVKSVVQQVAEQVPVVSNTHKPAVSHAQHVPSVQEPPHTEQVPSPADEEVVAATSPGGRAEISHPSNTEPTLTLSSPVQTMTTQSSHTDTAHPAVEVSEAVATQSTVTSSIQVQRNIAARAILSESFYTPPTSRHQLSPATVTRQSSATSVSISPVSPASVSGDSVISREKLLHFKQKVEKKGSVERDRQKIISAHLEQLRSNPAAVDDDVEPISLEVPPTCQSRSNTSFGRSSKSAADEDISLYLHLSSSESDIMVPVADRSHRRTGSFGCKASHCSATFRRECQLATHYTDFHPCDFGPPKDSQDIDLYNRYMSLPSQAASAASGKRKHSTPASQRGWPPKRTRTKSGSGRFECDDCGRKFARAGELNRHIQEAHFVSTDDEEY